MSNTQLVTAADFTTQVLAEKKTVLVDFYAEWCGPCKVMEPVIDALASEETSTKFVKVNVDESSDLAMQYNISSIPTFLVFKNGQVAGQLVGAIPKEQIKAAIQ